MSATRGMQRNSHNFEFSLAHLSALDLTPPELIMAAAYAEYQYVGLRLIPVTPGGAAWPLWDDKQGMAGTKARIADTGVRVLDIELFKLLPDTDVAGFLPCIEAAAEIGARHLLTQADDPEFHRVVANYGRLCELAAPFGLSCDVEFIPWIQTRNLADAGNLVSAAQCENGGVVIDTLHFARAGCEIAELRQYPSGWYHYVQLCDAPAQAPSSLDGLIYAAREERLFPGDGDLDLVSVLNELPLSVVLGIEIPAETLSFTSSPEERACSARESTLKLFKEIGYPQSRQGPESLGP